MSPQIYVCFGAGGVGKTTIAAALGTALAQRGLRTLVLTSDPARRLADALGVADAKEPVRVGADGLLWCFMPEASESVRRSGLLLFADDPDKAPRLGHNPILAALFAGLPGVHELGALAQLVEHGDAYDAVVLDTAPMRHALDVVRLPERLGKLVDSRALRWLASISRRRLAAAENGPTQAAMTRLFDWGESRLVAELEASLGPALLTACMELVAAGMDARPALSRIAEAARAMLHDERTTYVFVATPGEGTIADVAHLHEGLTALRQRPVWMVLNRGLEALPAWTGRLAAHAHAPESLRSVARLAARELGALVQQTRETRAALAKRFPRLLHAHVPALDASVPGEVVRVTAAVLGPLLEAHAASRTPGHCA